MSQIYDLELTDMQGRKMLVNAFDIAAVLPDGKGSQIILNVPVAATRAQDVGAKVEPYSVSVEEDVATLKDLRKTAARLVNSRF